MSHIETHKSHRTGWLRASVLGANDGIVSTASLIIGVAAANTPQSGILLAGVAGLVAGAMSMAAGEYVSVSSQADTENADLEIERRSLAENPEAEQQELKDIYQGRGLTPQLAAEVATQLTANDALGAHARDDIGISENSKANPIQAAFSSAAAFTLGAACPLLTAWLVPEERLMHWVIGLSLAVLATLGAAAAKMGGASMIRGATRVTFWGTLAILITALVGHFFDAII